MNKLCLITFELCPIISLLFSLLTVVATTMINDNQISPIFVYYCIQVYLNWFSINRISRGSATIGIASGNNQSKSNSNDVEIQIQIQKTNKNHSISEFRGGQRIDVNDHRIRTLYTSNLNDKLWYCEKCTEYTRRPSRHCVICKKCFHYRDHHCFFIGGCILRENMGNFILICLYTSLSSIYSLTILAPYLYEHLDHFLSDKSTAFDIVLNFSFPVALARFLFSGEESCIVLVTLFDALFSVSFICLVFGSWKFYACLTGRQRYFPYNIKKHDITEVFGTYGLWNFIFPINGILGAKSLPEQSYLWKEI